MVGKLPVSVAGQSSIAVAAAAVCAGALFIVGADAHPLVKKSEPTSEAVAVKPPPPPPAPAQVLPIGPEPDQIAASRAARRVVPRTLPHSKASESGLQIKTVLAARAVTAAFPEILTIGGVRSDSLKWHPHGLAIDVMIPNARSADGKALGDRVLQYALENANRFDLNHVIWRQTIYFPSGSHHMMSDLGSDTANHYDHVHIATEGGGYPTGSETYLR